MDIDGSAYGVYVDFNADPNKWIVVKDDLSWQDSGFPGLRALWARYSAAYYCATGAQISGEDAKNYQSRLSGSLSAKASELARPRREWFRQVEEGHAGFLQRTSPAARTAESVKPVLVGHSMGGNVALTLAALYPDVAAFIVLIDSLLFPSPEMAATLRHIAEALKGPAFEEVRAQVEPLFFLPTDDAAVRRDMTAVFAKTPQHVLHVGLGSRHFSPVLVPNQINAMIEDFVHTLPA